MTNPTATRVRHRLALPLAVGVLVPAVAVGFVLGSAAPAEAFAVCSGSSLCESGNLPLLEEAGIISSGTAISGAGAATIAVASGGVAALGTFNAAIGVVGAVTAVAAGAAVATGLLTSQGMPTGVKLKTAPGSGSAATPDCPPARVISPASAVLTGTDVGGFVGNCGTVQGQAHKYGTGTVAALDYSLTYTQTGTALSFTVDASGSWPTGYSTTAGSAGVFECLYVSGSSVTSSNLNARTSSGSQSQTCSLVNGSGGALSAVVYQILDGATETGRRYTALWSPDFTPGAAGWHGVIRTTVTCTGPDGDEPQTASQPVDVDSGGDLQVPTVQCPAGELATAVAIEFAPTATPDTWLPLTTGATSGAVKSLVTTYPDCFGPGVSPCTLQLQQKNGTTWTTCGPAATYCPDWVAEVQQDPDLYRCRYGSYELTIGHCSAYRRPGSVLANYDDATGSVEPITAPVPETLPNPVQGTDGEPVALPETDGADDDSDCFPSGWGVFNPLSWVLQPMQCAARWAFTIPQAEVDAIGNHIQDDWAQTAPGKLVSAVGAWEFDPPESGCGGITVDVSWLFAAFDDGPHTITIMQACEGDLLHDMAGWCKIFCNLAFIVGTVLAITRYIGGVYQFSGLGRDE